MKKLFYVIFFMFSSMYFLFGFTVLMALTKNIFTFPISGFFPMDFSINLDYECKAFLFMVSLVSSLVVLYGEFYMEHYNNKKFSYLVLAFFFSMIILSLSGSMLSLMFGWDSLGLSSLFLIMFYPGKIPMFNSLMTFFYNRLGDCFMMLILCVMLNNSSMLLFYLYGEDIIIISFFFILCSFTKSAQFPLSSWLPAAMSAPTPISAMVHSSTLVTAGILLILKFVFIFEEVGFLSVLLLHSSITFLIGGLLGVLNLDLKKIVAFSTMSQISMIIIFSSLIFVNLAYSHMIFHALFKTLIFCSCGLGFFFMFSDQLSKSLSMSTGSLHFFYMILISIFCMSGLPFSSSFFSKDIYLELCISEKFSYSSILILIGSVMTILYSSKIFSTISNSYFFMNTSNYKKKSFFYFMFLFSLTTLFIPYIMEFISPHSQFPLVTTQELGLILSMMILGVIYMLVLNKYLLILITGIFNSEYMTFSILSASLSCDKSSFHLNDHLMFKSNIFFNFSQKVQSNFKSLTLFIMFLFIYFVFFK